MWAEATKEGKVKYSERYLDPMTGKQKKVCVTFPKDTSRNKKEAQKILQQKIRDALSVTNAPGTELTLSEIKDKYIEEQSKQLKVSTWKRNERSLTSSIGYIGEDVIAEQLTAGFIRKKLLDSGKPNSQLNNYLIRFKAMIRWAYMNDYIHSTACIDKIAPFKEDEHIKEKLSEKFLEKEELVALLDGMTVKRWRAFSKVLVLSGMRIGELIALDNSDIDYENHTIRINKSYDRPNNTLSIGAKTSTSNRLLYMQPELEEAMKDLAEEQRLYMIAEGGPESSSKFLYDKFDRYVIYTTYNMYLARKSNDILGRKITPHIFRHTHVALLAEAGVPLEEISARLGHADSRITKKVYFHVTQKLEEQRRDRMRTVSIF